MLGRIEQLETELGGLLDALRRSGERLTEGLTALQADVGGRTRGRAGRRRIP